MTVAWTAGGGDSQCAWSQVRGGTTLRMPGVAPDGPAVGGPWALICLVPADPSPSMMATPFSRVYGVSLGTHLQELGRDIALPIEVCVLMLLSEGMREEVGKGLGASSHPDPPHAALCWACSSPLVQGPC